MKRDSAEKLREKTKDMTVNEELAFWRKRTEELRERKG